ncbi:MAG: alpha-hydroxy-acid oxidizing protein [Desulfovibrio sp.]|nr:alpha-hydroxy-acid oxidizing protein [Desulfovibrio sp.]MCA1985452.1 alpha-hydroxy-acid oxidizing protein [Desulfovibrio sp.]
MDLNTLRETARAKLKGYCRVCSICNGIACRGEVPGMGGVGSGSSFKANVEALSHHLLNMRTIHEVRDPRTNLSLFGCELDMPVLAAPMTGSTYNMGGAISEEGLASSLLMGSLQAGVMGMIGDGADPTMYASGLAAIREAKGRGIAIIKPRGQKEIIARIQEAEAAGAAAVGVDIDGAGLITMSLKGQPVGPKSLRELREVIQATSLPFIIKGIMTPVEAEMAVEAGAAAIVVSNHGGRVLDSTPGVAEVLPWIAEKVRNHTIVLADGGVRNGADVLKLLALGAQAVLVGRPLAIGAVGGGPDGVALLLNNMRTELIQSMLLTATADVRHVDRKILFLRQASSIG